jgi:UDP-N-acetylmuramate dehydrogenase
MDILQNQPLANYVTMRLGGNARYLCVVTSEKDLLKAIRFAEKNAQNIITIGQGSNIIFTDDGFDGLVIVNNIMGVTVNNDTLEIEANSGEMWDDIVLLSAINNWAGIESLSLIPGTVGGAPVNNIGAYGQEVKDTIAWIRAYDTHFHQFIKLSNKYCDFSYRDSIFKTSWYGRYIITKVALRLNKPANPYQPPQYPSLFNGTNPTLSPLGVRNLVIKTRSAKLPDPKLVANVGSFFKNPVVTNEKAANLQKHYPGIPSYRYGDKTKLAGGWLIEQCGLKNYRHGGMLVSGKQALVLINESAKSFNELDEIKNIIADKVKDKFGVTLVPEPEII